jgi:hypothetical protein
MQKNAFSFFGEVVLPASEDFDVVQSTRVACYIVSSAALVTSSESVNRVALLELHVPATGRLSSEVYG